MAGSNEHGNEQEHSGSINSATALYAVIGDPIGQSKSPLMHNAALRHLGMNGVYAAFHVLPARLEQAIDGMRALGIQGMNVTIPHKEAVMSYLDELDESARIIGAVNTIVNRDGKLIGYNTDGLGYVRALKEEVMPNLAQARILIIGAGGAARGIAYALLREGCTRLYIANRTIERANMLVDDLAGLAGVPSVPSFSGASPLPPTSASVGTPVYVDAIALHDQPAIDPEQIDLVIQTTSVGMHPNVDDLPFTASWLRPHMIVSDIIYNPLETAILREARRIGCRTHSGLGMFIHQGAIALEMWTNRKAPIQVMRDTVLQTLQ
ncbi:shikimate dehydrogenase [Paenibacillus sp. 481]|uniref:shikimate dehydrogenase n=1 Tax=Paenibacillus sp. 481 TaxID=2835869 RepID=UPI001E43D529|nr:shikimate dehydrogenase [Paenibacillus sp. 481]UHA74229.1 shikimate dehydrogenase [Paenibacillus sp. 481]